MFRLLRLVVIAALLAAVLAAVLKWWFPGVGTGGFLGVCVAAGLVAALTIDLILERRRARDGDKS